MLGFHEYNGSLKIDDYKFSYIDSENFRKSITYVPQDPQLFEDSIFENIKIGNKNIKMKLLLNFVKNIIIISFLLN